MRVNYGEDLVLQSVLIADGGTAFATASDITEGDLEAANATIDRDTFMASGVREPGLKVNLSARVLGFDSMSELPEPGDVLEENGGDGVATVIKVIAVAGTNLTTGDISGFIFVKNVSGTWTDDAQIDISGGSANVATVDAATTGTYAGNQLAASARPIAFAKGKAWIAITAEEMTFQEATIEIVDAEWESTSIFLETEGHPSAKYPNGARFAGIIGAPATDLVSAISIKLPNSGHADAHDWFDDAAVIAPANDDYINGLTIKLWDEDNPDLFEVAQIADWDADDGLGNNEGTLTLAGRGLTREPDLDGATTLRYIIYEDYYLVPDALGTQAKADAEQAVKDAHGVVTVTVAVDVGNTAAQFEVEEDAGAVERFGILYLTADNLDTEGRLVRWTGTAMVVVKPDSVPAGLEEIAAFSAEPDEGATGEFWPL